MEWRQEREGAGDSLLPQYIHMKFAYIYCDCCILCLRLDKPVYRYMEQRRERETNKERETHSGDAYIFTDVDGYCVCDAMLVSAGNSLCTRCHGL